jgi:hypothetical protein
MMLQQNERSRRWPGRDMRRISTAPTPSAEISKQFPLIYALNAFQRMATAQHHHASAPPDFGILTSLLDARFITAYGLYAIAHPASRRPCPPPPIFRDLTIDLIDDGMPQHADGHFEPTMASGL